MFSPNLYFTNIFHRLTEKIGSGYRILFCRGGTSSTKTWSILEILIIRAKEGAYVNVIGLTYKHLALGVLRDAMLICRMMNIPWSEYYKSTEHVLKFPDGGQINFLSIDKIDTAHGIRSGDLYINECNYQSWEIVDQLISRTSGLVFLDCNPSKKFWIVDKILENPAYEGVVYEDVSTYKDNPALAPATIHAIESHDRNSNWWRVYGLGEWGAHEGLVFHNVKMGEMPAEFRDKYRQRFGIDWGFAADAFAFVSGYVVEKDLYLTDEIYMHHALNKDTAPLVKEIAGHKKIICDSARPEAIAEFNSVYGLNCEAAKKPKGSVEGGYQTLQSFNNIYIDPKCRNLYREFTSLEYHKDKSTGDFTGEIEKWQDDHGIDATRYMIEDITLTKKSIRGMFLNMPAIDIKETIDRESLSMQPDLSLKDFLL